MQRAIKLFLVWRLLLFVPVVVGAYFLAARQGYNYLHPWANFDGIHYLSIAQRGYITQAAFFPLYPLLIRVLGGHFWAGFLIANVSFLLSLIVYYKLMRLDYRDSVAKQSILSLLIFPTAFYFASLYSESLFLLFLLCSFYFARKRKWFFASLFAFLLASTRLVGILILPALIYEFVVQEGWHKIRKAFPFLIIPWGLIAYAWFNLKKWGDALYFIRAHGELANSRSVESIVLFPQTIYRYFKILSQLPTSQYEWWIALLELGMFLFVSLLLYYAWKKKVRLSYLIFSFLAFLLPASSGTFTGLPRYAIILFPIYIVLASIKSRGIRTAYLIVSSVLLFILLMFFSRGYFVA